MKKMTLADAKPYEAPGHFGCVSLRLQGREETGVQRFWTGLSHFLPGGGAEFGATPLEKVYVVLEGEVTVKGADEEVVLRAHDSLYIGPDEGRSILNATHMPATMLVVINYPD
ncbi:MAG: cupin domain-containing protein [Thermoleophilia bacterium]